MSHYSNGAAGVCTSTSRTRSRKRARCNGSAASSYYIEDHGDDSITSETFAELQAPHPYGVLPLGNRLFTEDSTATKTVYSNEEGWNATHLLTEECWNGILSYLDGTGLAVMGQVSRFLYVAAHQPEVWRDLVLRQHQGTTLEHMASTWKDTHVVLLRQQKQNAQGAAIPTTNESAMENSALSAYRPHVPMAVPGVYSDVYYRQHSCRAFAIPSGWLSGNDDNRMSKLHPGSVVPKVPVQDMTTRRFVDEFERPNRPVLIQGAALEWAAFTKWNGGRNGHAYCAAQTAHQTFRATSGVAPYPAQFTWQSYSEYCGFTVENGEDNATAEAQAVGDGNPRSHVRLLEEGPLYLFDRAALQPNSVLWKDYMPDLQRTCPYWDPNRRATETSAANDANDTTAVGHDLFGILGEGRRPDHTWLIVGPKRSGSVFHLDPNCTHAWNAAICGRKRWIFYPPGVTPPGIHPSDDGDEVALPLSIGEWLFQFWDEHCQRKATSVAVERPMECTAMPGDVLFVPHGWWHMVINLDDVNIAITHNYVSSSNLSNVLKFLHTKRHQVSGCRDRKDSIKPERLYEEFVQAMQEQHPTWLQAAMAVPHWTCRAWSDTSIVQQPADRDNEAKGRCTDSEASSLTKTSTSVIEKAKEGAFTGFSFSFHEQTQ